MKALQANPGGAWYRSLTDWYRVIEPGIRSHVHLLRDNGFNTYSSCQERMEVALDIATEEDIARLDHLLSRNGFKDYQILVRWERCREFLRSSAVVQFGDKGERHRIARRYCSLASWWWDPPPEA
jgi:hypothetical protein